jgi:hypothetical protein
MTMQTNISAERLEGWVTGVINRALTEEPRHEAYAVASQLQAMLKSPGALRGHEDVIEAAHTIVCAILRKRFGGE